jgi:hypothetical protein
MESQSFQGDRPQICSVTGKRKYASKGEAKATATHRLTDKQYGPAQLKTYKCQYCDSWHLTSKK